MSGDLVALVREQRDGWMARALSAEAHEKRVEAIVDRIVTLCQDRANRGLGEVKIADVIAAVKQAGGIEP